MHPNLAEHLHPVCYPAARALEECHIEHPYAKYLGACNQVKKDLMECLQKEYEIKKAENTRLSKLRQERIKRVREQVKEIRESGFVDELEKEGFYDNKSQ